MIFNAASITKAAGIIIAIGSIVGAVLAVDERYAHAVDMDKYQQQNTSEMRSQLNDMRIQAIEDKLFELESKANKTSYDYALIERYKRQLDEAKSKK